MNRNASLLLALLSLTACEPVVSKDTVKLVKLPADITEGPGSVAVETREGRIFVSPISGGMLRLEADAGTWAPITPVVKRLFHDFKDRDAFGEGSTGGNALLVAKGDAFVPVEPAVPPLTHASFGTTGGYAGLRGRDAQGAWWAASAPSFGAFDNREFLFHFDPAVGGDWVIDEIPLANAGQTLPAASPTMTSDARFFFRPNNSGLWEVDVANHQMVERVPCTHELFRASHPDYVACQQDTFLVAGLNGQLFIYTATDELWRIGSRETIPTLVVKGSLPSLVTKDDLGFNRYRPGAPSLYVDPRGRVWLAFRWGDNSTEDVTYLYEAEPDARDGWTFLSNSLPRNLVLFGEASTPLLVSQLQDTGLLVYRVTLP